MIVALGGGHTIKLDLCPYKENFATLSPDVALLVAVPLCAHGAGQIGSNADQNVEQRLRRTWQREWIARARALKPLLEAAAPRIEQAKTMPP